MVYKLDSWISKSYVTETYDSCKNVIMSSTNGPAMDFLCGPWGAYRCTPERWYDYMGSTSNGFSPFDIVYHYVDNSTETEMTPIDPVTYHCSQTVPGSSKACSCVDCVESCPAAPTYPPLEEQWMLFGEDGINVVMGIVFILGSILIIFAVFIQGSS